MGGKQDIASVYIYKDKVSAKRILYQCNFSFLDLLQISFAFDLPSAVLCGVSFIRYI